MILSGWLIYREMAEDELFFSSGMGLYFFFLPPGNYLVVAKHQLQQQIIINRILVQRKFGGLSLPGNNSRQFPNHLIRRMPEHM
jgi:hypothetical protein